MAAAFIEMMRRWDDRIALGSCDQDCERRRLPGYPAASGCRGARRRRRARMSRTISSPWPRAFSMNSRLASLPLAMTPAR